MPYALDVLVAGTLRHDEAARALRAADGRIDERALGTEIDLRGLARSRITPSVSVPPIEANRPRYGVNSRLRVSKPFGLFARPASLPFMSVEPAAAGEHGCGSTLRTGAAMMGRDMTIPAAGSP
ncbi:MAG: hypothetical protein ACREVR_20975 [Burkholderiales bacterium]